MTDPAAPAPTPCASMPRTVTQQAGRVPGVPLGLIALGILAIVASHLPGAGAAITGTAGVVCCLVVLTTRSLRRAGQRIDLILTEELQSPGHRLQ
jgi:hypothetical protein